MDAWRVHKFGGSSVADAACFRRVARHSRGRSGVAPGRRLSACRGVTDDLLALVDAAERPRPGVGRTGSRRSACATSASRASCSAPPLTATSRGLDRRLQRSSRRVADRSADPPGVAQHSRDRRRIGRAVVVAAVRAVSAAPRRRTRGRMDRRARDHPHPARRARTGGAMGRVTRQCGVAGRTRRPDLC